MLNAVDSTKGKSSKLDSSSSSSLKQASKVNADNLAGKNTKASNLESTVDKINTSISSLSQQQKASLLKDKSKTLSDSTLKLNASQDVEMEESSNEKGRPTLRSQSMNESADHQPSNHNNNAASSLENATGSKLMSKLSPESVSIPLTHWSLQGPITTVNLTESTSNGYFLMHAPIDLISASAASLSQTSLNNLNGFVGATLNASALGAPASPPSCSSSINSSPNSTGAGSGNGGVKIVRDERRRANHNEVERRRRDNINKWIVELSKVIPDCSNDQSKHGQSKGGILEKTVQYLCLLKDENQRLIDQVKHLDRIQHENVLLNQQNETFLKENTLLRAKLNENGQQRTANGQETSSNGLKED